MQIKMPLPLTYFDLSDKDSKEIPEIKRSMLPFGRQTMVVFIFFLPENNSFDSSVLDFKSDRLLFFYSISPTAHRSCATVVNVCNIAVQHHTHALKDCF